MKLVQADVGFDMGLGGLVAGINSAKALTMLYYCFIIVAIGC